MAYTGKISFHQNYDFLNLTLSYLISIIGHSIIIIFMVYLSYKAVSEEKTFVIYPGKTMQVNIYRPGELGANKENLKTTTRIKKYQPEEAKPVLKEALPELNPPKKEEAIPVKAKNLPISSQATAGGTSGSTMSIGIGGPSLGISGGEVFPYSYYIDIVLNKLSSNWRINIVRSSKQKIFDAEIWFRISRNGDLLDYKLLKSSGNEIYDDNCLRAVTFSSPFPPLPYQYEGKTLALSITFHYSLD